MSGDSESFLASVAGTALLVIGLVILVGGFTVGFVSERVVVAYAGMSAALCVGRAAVLRKEGS